MNCITRGMWRDPKREKTPPPSVQLRPTFHVLDPQGSSSRPHCQEVLQPYVRPEALQQVADAMSSTAVVLPFGQTSATEPRSAFAVLGMKGCVYIEAKSQDDVVHLC